MLVIGLTGGIGSGKSTISQMLREHGATIIDADKVGHEAYLPHQNVWGQVVAAFGPEVVGANDEIDRRQLGGIVFSDPEQLEKLNRIVHPWMYQRLEQLVEEERQRGTGVVVIEAAILIEAGWTPLVDQVWVTLAPEEAVVQRIGERSGLNPDQVRARIRSQMANDERRKHGDVVLDTNCSLEETRKQVDQLWERLQVTAAGAG